MSNEVVVQENTNNMLDEITNTEKVCLALMKTPHYAKMGKDGIFAIVQKANSLGIKPIEALNGGMYFVQGKVELSAILMAKLIRQQKHSITMDKNSNNTCCILHGKRADNGDTWRASFSIEDAKRAGIYKDGGPWHKYPDVMCYNRALSKLARQLFPDVIGNCYVEGEIDTVSSNNVFKNSETVRETISENDALALEDALNKCSDEFQLTVRDFLQQRFGTTTFELLPKDMFKSISTRIASNQIVETNDETVVIEETKSVSDIANNMLANMQKTA